MASHSRIFAWRIPWTEEPGGLQSMGSNFHSHRISRIMCVCVCVCVCGRIPTGIFPSVFVCVLFIFVSHLMCHMGTLPHPYQEAEANSPPNSEHKL